MSAALEKMLDLAFFKENGFERKKCASCGSWFRTLDADRTVCGDAPCVEYSFLDAPLTDKRYGLDDMREAFLGFFEDNDHERVARQPVVARWREDIYLTIASIADFQPFVTSGEVPPPANPLTISQPCIRLNDLANVGKSGRHLTLFEMMAHHAFNRPDDEIYWADQTVAYADEFLSDRLGFDREKITYKENPWAGGGNAGPAVEVLSGGLEVATLVFMNLEQHPAGEFDVKGDTYREMDLKIVDTGWGLERLVWASRGTPTCYDAIFPDLLSYVRENSEAEIALDDPETAPIVAEHARLAGVMDLDANTNLDELRKGVAKRLGEKGVTTTADGLAELMSPIEDLYALADHARCLAFMLGDGIVPSNAKAGYLARLVIRRSLRLMENLSFGPTLRELVLTELEFLSDTFPELGRNEATVADMLDLETTRYEETIAKGRRMVANRVKRGETIGTSELLEFYDSHGLPPQIVKEVAESAGATVEIPDAFDAMVAERHSKQDAADDAEKDPLDEVDLPPTKMVYYDEPDLRTFDASVLWSDDGRVVLDRTIFYPEGGGQPHDKGRLKAGDKSYPVEYVEKKNGLIVHHVDGKIKTGEVVEGRVDWDRRTGHMRHHTATHIVCGAARAVVGEHVWQTGAQKAVDHARIDLTHYKRFTPQDLEKIEALANEIVMRNVRLDRVWMERDEAEKKYGVEIYQGGVAPGKDIRIIRINEHDVEACAGTHVGFTSEVGPIKLLKSERIQDGVERLTYSAGPSALAEVSRRESWLREASDTLSVPVEKLPETVQRFFAEWKEQRKTIEDLRTELATLRQRELVDSAAQVGDARLVVSQVGADELEAVANAVTGEPKSVVVLGATADGRVRLLVARSSDLDAVHAGQIVKQAAAVVGGSGGGKPEAAQGGGTDPSKLDEALALAEKLVRDALEDA